MKNIWVCQHWWGVPKNKALSTSKKEFGENYKVGRRSSFNKLVERCLSKRSSRWYLPTLWAISRSLKVWSRNWKLSFKNSGEGTVEIVKKYIGLSGKDCVKIRRRKGWDLKTLKNLMILCWPSRFGVWLIIRILYAIECSKLDFFRIVQSLKLRILLWGPMHGRAL